ncbi:polyketide synthase dehydratase domain-containing protein, partial [Streptomyces odontomachi]|uniref:polyketide synthase dehydratase domain-containing protein n=1 Tax=Streptomyces odontomachi TaxID=2944940 RepID=UPI00210A4312
FVELALHAGLVAGLPRLVELTLQQPLVVPGEGAVEVQLAVGPDGVVSVHARPRSEGGGEAWTLHATGVLDAQEVAEPERVVVWPPAGAGSVAVADFYDVLAGQGYGYGPLFQGLRAAWRDEAGVYAEVVLPEEAG